MNKNDVIEYLYKNKIVAQIIRNISHGFEDENNMRDLEQDIYLILLEKPDKFIEDLYNKQELSFWLANVIYTQIRSSSSPYYKKYKKFLDTSKCLDNLQLTYEQNKF